MEIQKKMGKKVNQKSFRISKNSDQKKQFNSLIKVLKPKVYITDNSSFKRLVQELTGNGGSRASSPTAEAVPENVPVLVEPESSIEGSIDVSTESFELCNQVSFYEEPSHGYGQISGVLSMNQQVNQEIKIFGHQEEPQTSMEGSLDASFDSFEFCNQVSFYEEPSPGYGQISGILPMNQPANQEVKVSEYQEEPESSMEVSLDAPFDSFEFFNQVSFTEESNHGYDQIPGIISVNQQVNLEELESWLLDMDPSPVYDTLSQIQQELGIHDCGFYGLM